MHIWNLRQIHISEISSLNPIHHHIWISGKYEKETFYVYACSRYHFTRRRFERHHILFKVLRFEKWLEALGHSTVSSQTKEIKQSKICLGIGITIIHHCTHCIYFSWGIMRQKSEIIFFLLKWHNQYLLSE